MSSTAEGRTWATSGFEPNQPPKVFVQWKGTEVCLDFTCECGYGGHYDGGFAYGLKCGGCGQVWTMPHTFGLIKGGADDIAQETDWPHRDAGRSEPVAAAVPGGDEYVGDGQP